MKAIVYHAYGGPDVLRCEEVPTPEPGEDEVLIKVRAASVNPMDYHMMSGVYLMRLMTGLRRPKMTRPGVDVAGGRNVTGYKPGDPVFGAARGAFAEYVCAKQDKIALMPAGIGFEQAAAIPVAGLTALQALRDKATVRPGHRVLVTGASGGVGSFAVQIARTLGAEVTAVCSTRSIDLVRSLGAAHVIDYSREDFTRGAVRYDVILDAVGSQKLSACLRVLTPKGVFLPIGVRAVGRWVGPLPHLLKLVVSRPFVSQTVTFFIARITPEDLTAVAQLIVAKQVTPVIDRVYPMSETLEALRHAKQGHPQGKVIVMMT